MPVAVAFVVLHMKACMLAGAREHEGFDGCATQDEWYPSRPARPHGSFRR